MKKFKSLFKCRLDERQLKIRGNIYFKSFSVLSFIIIAIFFIKEIFNIDLMIGDWEYLIALFISITYCFILLWNISSNKGPVSFIIYIFWSLWIWFFWFISIFNYQWKTFNHRQSIIRIRLWTNFHFLLHHYLYHLCNQSNL